MICLIELGRIDDHSKMFFRISIIVIDVEKRWTMRRGDASTSAALHHNGITR
jgi:hypothetical protein